MADASPTKTLRRGHTVVSLSASDWTNILLQASRSGWRPERPTYFFIASGFDVLEREALALARTIEDMWATASEDPFSTALEPTLELATLMEVGAFCLGGAFRVE